MKKSKKNNINTLGNVYSRGMHNDGIDAMNCCVASDWTDYSTASGTMPKYVGQPGVSGMMPGSAVQPSESGTMPGRAVHHSVSGTMPGHAVHSRASGIRPSQDTLLHEVGISAGMYAELKKYEEEKEAERERAEIKRKLAIVGLFSLGAVLAVIVVFGMRYWI